METNTELYKKLLELQKAVRGLFPEKQGGTGNYKYVSGNKLLSVVRPKMDELGLLLKSEIVDIVNTRQDYKVGRENAVTNKHIVSSLKGSYKLNDARVRKIINHFRRVFYRLKRSGTIGVRRKPKRARRRY